MEKKDEKKRRDRLNRSMVFTKPLKKMGIAAAHQEEGVIYLATGEFVKVYSITGTVGISDPRFASLFFKHCAAYRLRLSVFHTGGKDAIFLSVFVRCADFAKAHDMYAEFEGNALAEFAAAGVSAYGYTADGTLSAIYANFYGDFCDVTLKKLTNKKKEDGIMLYPALSDKDGEIYMDCRGRYAKVMIADPRCPVPGLCGKSYGMLEGMAYQACIDTQQMDPQCMDTYIRYIKKMYNIKESSEEFNLQDVLEIFCEICLFAEGADKLRDMEQYMRSETDINAIFYPLSGHMAREAFYSMGSMGISGFVVPRSVATGKGRR